MISMIPQKFSCAFPQIIYPSSICLLSLWIRILFSRVPHKWNHTYVIFCFWLLSFRVMLLRFIHGAVFTNDLFFCCWIVYLCMTIFQVDYSFTCLWKVGLCPVWNYSGNNPTLLWTLIYKSVWRCFHFSWVSRVELL